MTSPTNTTSINQLLRRHSRERLFVKPIRWTNRQIELLGCQFIARRLSRWPTQPFSYQASLPPSATSSSGSSGADDDLEGDEWRAAYGYCNFDKPIEHAQKMTQGQGAVSRRTAVIKLLDYGILRPDLKRQSVHFCFDGTRFSIPIPCLVFSRLRPRRLAMGSDETAVPPFPLVIWFDHGPYVGSLRRNIYPERRKNAPVAALHKIHLRRITPAAYYRDPYIVAALIALAQAQKHWEEKYHPGVVSEVFTTRLILSYSENQETVHLYMADVSAAFLDKLAHPDEFETTSSSLQVFCDEIKSRPAKTFRERLLQRLSLAEETEVEGDEQLDKMQGIKRKRSNDDEENMPGPSDQRSETSPVVPQ
ncbi:hypothetical protein F4818DRAFT_58005 [Hypoxylon cercidicola]|nr:hypothetical protein F4818DRAFT_58005 [Hypoxylon cercidicola]